MIDELFNKILITNLIMIFPIIFYGFWEIENRKGKTQYREKALGVWMFVIFLLIIVDVWSS